jgi:hypothetical protein
MSNNTKYILIIAAVIGLLYYLRKKYTVIKKG